MRALSLLTVLVLLAAGCVTLPGGEESTPDAAADDAAAPSLLPDLSDVPEPPVDVTRARTWWQNFVESTPYRFTQTPTNDLAADMLKDGLTEAGFEVREFYYLPPLGTPSPTENGVRAIVGIKEGSVEPEHVIGWVAHYDTNAATIYGAYDDGSGTGVAMELARTLSGYDNRKTLMPIFFDAEEIGLVASQYFVQQAMQSGEYQWDLVIGHDMTGINCPGHEWQMYQFIGENFLSELKPIVQELYQQVFTPELNDCITFVDSAPRNSDERRFKEEGVPVIRMAGGLNASDYPEYHKPGDTVDYVIDFAGGVDNYEAGLKLTIEASYWNAVTFDRLPALN